ncbi:unnamed protein product [Rotaria sp. Silwood2]|nr:unnamed protein product [Rotaria sp. Silwood2]CAF2921924.1 unnamed protein product [Rotaria sp. Silwood2]CAF4128484.1 unnamed protein product [Rotaria sp. Silwood2]
MSKKTVSSPNSITKLTSVTSKTKKTDRSTDVDNVSRSDRHPIKREDNHESVIFIRLDTEGSSSINLIGPLRSIHNSVRSYSNSASCLDAMRSIKEKIFFICSFFNIELLMTVQNIENVEAIFILDPNSQDIKGDFPKLIGVFTQQEELFRSLKETLETFEQIQLERFSFEKETLFLWYQLWKEELTHRKASSNKTDFIEMARLCYRDNSRIMEMIDEFEKSYRSSEILHWCFRSPFPNRFLHHAIHSHNLEQLNVCRFIFIDANRFFQQQPKHKSSDQFYRGMKLTKEVLDQFESHVGQLVCTSGFFPCTKSRTHALSLASLPGYRSDLLSVLFKIDCDSTSMYSQLSNKMSSNVIIFDVSISFRVINVHRGQMSVIKMKPAIIDGKQIAQDYLEQHHDQSIKSVLDQLLAPPRVQTPPLSPPPPLPLLQTIISTTSISTRSSSVNDNELEAQKHLEQGQIDLALAAYRRIYPVSAKILNIIGRLCAEKKKDYDCALEYHTQALRIQEQTGEDFCDTLADLGNIHHCRGQYDLALDYHRRALTLRESLHPNDVAAQATSLLAIGNAHWARREFDQAIEMTQRALTLQETIQPVNETSIGTTLATLGNIYQDSGKHQPALDMCTRALAIFERNLPADSPVIAELLEEMGVIQLDLRALDDAKQIFERVVDIYTKILPQRHPNRVSAEVDLERVNRLIQKKKSKVKKHT